MNIFLLATLASIVLYYGSRVALTIYLTVTGLGKKEGQILTGFLPNTIGVFLLIGYLGMIVNGTLLAALTVKNLFL